MTTTTVLSRRSALLTGALGALALTALTGTGACSRGGSGSNYIAVITPSHDNPFFKTEAEAAVAAAQDAFGIRGLCGNAECGGKQDY